MSYDNDIAELHAARERMERRRQREKKFRISKDTVTGDTKEELETDIMQLTSIKYLMENGGMQKSAAVVYETINELIDAKREKLKKVL